MKRFKSLIASILAISMILTSGIMPAFAAGNESKVIFFAGETKSIPSTAGVAADIYCLQVDVEGRFESLDFVVSYNADKIQPVKLNKAGDKYADVAEPLVTVTAEVKVPDTVDEFGDPVPGSVTPYRPQFKTADSGNRKGISTSIFTAADVTDASKQEHENQTVATFLYRYKSGEPAKGDLRLEIAEDSAVLEALGYKGEGTKNGLLLVDAQKNYLTVQAGTLDYSFSYVGSDKVSLGALELAADKAAVEVNGSLDAADHAVELTLTAKDTDGDAMTLPANTTYEFDAGTTTASLSDDGTIITIPKDSTEGTITVKAASGTVESNVVTIAVTRATSVAAKINLSDKDVEIDGIASKTVTASAKDQFGAGMTPAWSVSPADQGVSIAADGTITIAADAKADDYEIYANGDEKSETLTVERTSVAKTVVVNGPTNLQITDKTGASATYTAEVTDYFGEKMDAEIEWSVWSKWAVADLVDSVDATGNITINQDGELIVPYDAVATGIIDIYYVGATVKGTQVSDTHEVKITKEGSKATTIELTGSAISGDTITVNGPDMTIGVTVKDQYGKEISNPQFSVQGAGSKGPNYVIVMGDAANGATVTVTCGDATKTLTVVRAASVPSSIKLSKTADTIKIGNSKTYTVTVEDQFRDDVTNDVTVTWSSNNAKVTVENGVVTVAADAAVGSTATITVTAGDKSDTLTITVKGKDDLEITAPDPKQTFIYDGTAKAYSTAYYTVETAGFTGTPVVTYTDAQGNEVAAPTNAGTYNVKIVWEDANFYAELPATLVIDQAEIDASAAAWDYTAPFTYAEGTERTVALQNLPEKVEAVYGGTTKATDADEYTATATLCITDSNYKFKAGTDAVADCKWEIKPQTVIIEDSDLVWNYTAAYPYSGAAQSVALTCSNDKATVSYADGSENSCTNAGDYTATAVLAPVSSNYVLECSDEAVEKLVLDWKIVAKAITVESVVGSDKTYDGKTDAVVTNVVFDGLADGESVAYTTKDVAFANANAGTGVKVTGTVELDVAVKNYTLADGAFETTANINPADYTVEVADKLDVKAGATNLKSLLPTATATASVAGEEINGTLSWNVEDDSVAALKVGDTFTANWCYVQTNGNYVTTEKTGSTVITIVEGNPQTIAFNIESATETYGAAPFTEKATLSVGAGEIRYTSSKTDVATVDADGKVTIKGVGTTTITAIAAAVPGEWAQATDFYTLTVTAREIAVDVTAQTITYGDALPTEWAFALNDSYRLGYDDELEDLGLSAAVESAEAYNVGSYDVTVTIDNANYVLINGKQADKLTVEQKGIDVPTAKTGLVYTGSAQTGVAAGEGYTLTGNTATDVDDYTAIATIDSNYKWNADFDGKIEWSIAQASAKSFADQTVTAYSKVVTTEDQVFTVSLADMIAALGTDAKIKAVFAAVGSDANISAAADGSAVVITVKPTEAAEEAASFCVVLSSKNYEDSAVAINVTVVDKTDVSTKITFGNKTVIWNGEAKALAAAKFNGTASGTGKITYSVDGETWSETMPTFTDAGAYTVTAKYEDDTQMGTDTAVLTITNKLDVAVAVIDNADFVNNGKYKILDVTNEADENAAYVEVKGTKSLAKSLSTDPAQDDEEHKWIGLLIETTKNGEITTDLYYSVDGETFTKLDASEFTVSAENGGDGKQFILWIATDVNDELTRWIATDAEGTDALEMIVEFDAYKKPSSGSSSSSLDERKAEKVEEMIDEIGSKVTLDDQDEIEEAREAYDDLTKAQKKLVDNYDKLVKAEKKLEKLLEAQGDLPFTDVDEDDDIYDAVKFVYDNGLMVGVGDGTMFAPEAGLTRAMIARILHAYEGEPAAAASAFTDVARGMWYTAAIDWAAANKVVSGYGNGLYGPNDTLTREQLAVIMYYYAQSKGYDVSAGLDTNILSYNDAFSISSWAMPAMQWACAEDILTDANGFISPTAAATRADVAEAFMAFMLRYEK